MTSPPNDTDPPAIDPVLVAISGSPGSVELVRAGHRLAEALAVPWEAFHVEVPGADETRHMAAADALGIAARSGATIATIPAASVADGIEAHLESFPAGHIVVGRGGEKRDWLPGRRSLAAELARRATGLAIHVYPCDEGLAGDHGAKARAPSSSVTPPRSYAYAAAFVGVTLLVAEVLTFLTGPRSLDLLFLFPVIAVAARLGLRPALLAATLSVISYNYFLLTPAFSFDPRAPQNLVMAIVLIVVALYTSIVTTQMRGRVRLSDRSARENASIAALAQRLTRDADWAATALTVCEYAHNLLNVNAMAFREVDGQLEMAAAFPQALELGPVDRAALEWAWTEGEETGAGTTVLSASDWQFQPLKTSLGMLAVLALAREDGRDPIRADQRILLSTLVAQAALAHERLRLEDAMRAAP